MGGRRTGKKGGKRKPYETLTRQELLGEVRTTERSYENATPSGSCQFRQAMSTDRGRVWWVRYSHGGKQFRESSESTKEADAKRLLKKRLGEIYAEKFVPPAKGRMTVNELLDELVRDHEVNKRKGVKVLGYQIKPVRAALGFFRSLEITEGHLQGYTRERLEEGKAHATVNKELGALRRAFNLAKKRKQLSEVPTFELLREDNARQGFVEPGDFEAIARRLSGDVRDFAAFAFLTGWRKGEIASLRWADVDMDARTLSLRRESAKNGRGRLVALEGQLLALIKARLKKRQTPRGDGTVSLAARVFHRGGKEIKDFRAAWTAAVTKAGLPETLFHDLRRSAVRAMIRAGVSQTVAMKISGHRSTHIFNRYDITSDDDVREAVKLTQAYVEENSTKRRGTGSDAK